MKFSGYCGCGVKLTLEGSTKDLSLSIDSNGSRTVRMKDLHKSGKDVITVECPVCGLKPSLKKK
jgi:hypothetical protein